MKRITNAQVQSVIKQVCKANGVPTFAAEISIEWSLKMSRDAGIAKPNNNTVCLSEQVMPLGDTESQKEVVAHNVCHLIAWRESSHLSHGKPWKDCVAAAGYDPANMDPISSKTLKRKSTLKFTCKCGKRPTTLGPTMAKRIAGKVCNYHCPKCNGVYKIAKGA